MKRRKFIISLSAISSTLFFLPIIKNFTKDDILQKFIKSIESNYNSIASSKIEKNKFYKNLLNENYDNIETLKIIVKNKIINDYKNNNLILVKNRYLSETEFYLYSLKS
mgnify:CR=1 FL=1|tara:strand:- start:4370 stop:4696 length:327 start_codon:yes stop_codon:yes gene_type:complete